MATHHWWNASVLAITLSLCVDTRAQSTKTIDDFFDGSALQEIHLTMLPGDWLSLKEHFELDTYYPCQMQWNEMIIKDAAVRSRGSGSRNPIKPGLGVDFSKYVPAQRFLGMKSFVMRNSADDPSMLHERLTMGMFQALGLPFLRAAHAKLYVNDAYEGLYLLVEAIDSRFLTSRFGESNGYLFEAKLTGFNWEYLGDNTDLYVPAPFEPKNHDSDPQAAWIVGMIRAINLSSDDEFAAAVSRYLDMDAFLAHLAVEQYLVEWDGILGELGANNYYFYRREADDRAIFLVWDKEVTFALVTSSIWRNTDKNVLARRALAVPEFRNRYLETVAQAAQVAGGPGGWLESEALRMATQIRQAALEDPNRVCAVQDRRDHCPESEFTAGLDRLIDFIRQRNQSLEAEGLAAAEVLRRLEPGAARNAASDVARLAPGELVRIHLPDKSRATASASAFPLPAELDGLSVRIGRVPAALLAVDTEGLLVQTPLEVICGAQTVEVIGPGAAGNAITVEVRPSAPGVFGAFHSDGTVIAPQQPARPGEWIVVYVTGLGRPRENLATGDAAPESPLVTLQGNLMARVGGLEAKVVWAGFTPGFAGIQQVNLEVPPDLKGPGKLELIMYGEVGQPYEIPL
jgi:uncharacterized protein (TIGR03437 family)